MRPVAAISSESKTESPEGGRDRKPARAGAAAVRPPDDHGYLWIDQDGVAAVASVLSGLGSLTKTGDPAFEVRRAQVSWLPLKAQSQAEVFSRKFLKK